jgi:hypothetical protein
VQVQGRQVQELAPIREKELRVARLVRAKPAELNRLALVLLQRVLQDYRRSFQDPEWTHRSLPEPPPEERRSASYRRPVELKEAPSAAAQAS